MIQLPYVSPSDFFELIEYARLKNMCTKLFCTTCGALEFRKLCRETIGKEQMILILNAVNEEEVNKHQFKSWYEPLTVILREFSLEYPFGNLISKIKDNHTILLNYDNPLLSSYIRSIRLEIEKRQERRSRNMQNDLNNHVLALARKEAKREAYRLNKESCVNKRERIISSFVSVSLEQKMLQIANDSQHMPSYYPIDLACIAEEEIKNFSDETLSKVIYRFSKLKKPIWKNFCKRISNELERRSFKNE